MIISGKKLYQVLDLEYLHQRWMRRLCLFYKVFHSKVPKYIHSLIPSIRTSTRQRNTFTSFHCRTKYFQNSFLPCVIREWNKLNPDKQSCLSYNSFRKALLNFIRPNENRIFNIHDQVGIKLLTRLRLGFNQLCEHKLWVWRHFKPVVPLQHWGRNNVALFLRCQFFNDIRQILMNDLMNIDRSLLSLSQDNDQRSVI